MPFHDPKHPKTLFGSTYPRSDRSARPGAQLLLCLCEGNGAFPVHQFAVKEVICNSDMARDEIKKHFGLPDEKLPVICVVGPAARQTVEPLTFAAMINGLAQLYQAFLTQP